MSGFGMTPDTLMLLQNLGVQSPGPMATTLPTIPGAPAGVQQPGLPPDALAGLLQEPDAKPFPTEAAMLAGLGAAGMGLRAGASRGPAPSGGLPVASVPARGLQSAPFRLPR